MEQTEKNATKSQSLEITLVHRENEYEVIRATEIIDLIPGAIIDYDYINKKLQYKIQQQVDINSKFLLGDTVTGKKRFSQEKFIGKIVKKRGTVSKIKLEDGQTFFLMNSEITKLNKMKFYPITQIPKVSKDSSEFSETVLIYDKLDNSDEIYYDLGYYDFATNTWKMLGGLQMNIICWSYIPLPDLSKQNFTETFLTN